MNFVKQAGLSLSALIFLLMPPAAFALDLPQLPKEEYARGEIVQVLEDTVLELVKLISIADWVPPAVGA